jgi:hypothetical protein
LKKLSFGLWILLALISFSSKAWSLELCTADEKAYFSCQVRNSPKVASLCGSKSLTATQGYLQYRFGIPGKVEMEFPKDKQNTQKAFLYMHYFRAQDDQTQLSFDNNGTSYTIYSDYNGETKYNGGKVVDEKGVRVTLPGKAGKEVEFKCQNPVVFHVGDLSKIVPCDSENGSCN